MNNNLEHKTAFAGYGNFTSDVTKLILDLDQKHYLERKVKFILDVRGYLKTNSLKGNYIEFGSYRSEMQYAAFQILKDNKQILNYVGVDTFKGEPKKSKSDVKLNLYDTGGDFACEYSEVNSFVQNTMCGKGILIKGDFRNSATADKITKYKNIIISVIDCNLLSSIEEAFNITLKNIVEGGIIYLDDFFYNFKITKEIYNLMRKSDKYFIEHNFYPPFAKSFIVVCK